MAKDDIAIDDDENLKPQVNGANGAAVIPEGNEPEESVESLKAQLERARSEAQARARELDEERRAKVKTGDELVDTRLTLLDNAFSSTEAQLADAKKRQKEAYEAGDYDKVTDINLEMSELSVKKRDLQRGKEAVQLDVEQRKARPSDPIEAYVANMPARAQNWIRSHPEVVKERKAELERAHYRALGEGIAEGSDEYYQSVEQTLGYADAERPNVMYKRGQEPSAEERTEYVAAAAPPSRANVNISTGKRNNTRTLGPRERDTAQMLGMTEVEYAKELDRLEKEGQLTHQKQFH